MGMFDSVYATCPKEDEELEQGDIEDAIDEKEITVDEIVARFRRKLLLETGD